MPPSPSHRNRTTQNSPPQGDPSSPDHIPFHSAARASWPAGSSRAHRPSCFRTRGPWPARGAPRCRPRRARPESASGSRRRYTRPASRAPYRHSAASRCGFLRCSPRAARTSSAKTAPKGHPSWCPCSPFWRCSPRSRRHTPRSTPHRPIHRSSRRSNPSPVGAAPSPG